MHVLLDECLPRRIKAQFLDDFIVATVQERGWSGKRNGELMRLAETDFDAFVTMDRNIKHQQNLAGFNLVVVLLRATSNRFADVLPLLPELIDALRSAVPGRLHQVPNE